ncbi:hypothetical protein CEK25_010750 [Fusarium fujikuroi]|nr:hypothetical protein CEK25_010750 [Fusarium fujikuroi]
MTEESTACPAFRYLLITFQYTFSSNAIDELRDGINAYDDLIRRLLRRKTEDNLDPKELHNQVKDRVKRALDRIALLTDPRAATIASPSDQDPSSQSPFSQNQHRYLGEVSDVHFFNLVKGFLQTKDSSNPEQGFDSYKQDGEVSTTNNESSGHTLLPATVDTRELAEVYFSTIHIAYPFIPQSPFMANLAREGGIPNNATDLAILYVICAIGSYYTSFPGRDAVSQTRHECYFQRAMALTAATSGHHSIQQVTLLLVQCFYLLTVSKTDSGFDSEGLRDDAETCLKIFEALIARNMIQGLKQSGSEWRKQAGQGTDVVPFSQTLSQPDASMELQHTSATGVPVSQEMLSLQDQNVELLSDAIPTPQNWPAEITDSMAWSSQFLDTFQGDGSWI